MHRSCLQLSFCEAETSRSIPLFPVGVWGLCGDLRKKGGILARSMRVSTLLVLFYVSVKIKTVSVSSAMANHLTAWRVR